MFYHRPELAYKAGIDPLDHYFLIGHGLDIYTYSPAAAKMVAQHTGKTAMLCLGGCHHLPNLALTPHVRLADIDWQLINMLGRRYYVTDPIEVLRNLLALTPDELDAVVALYKLTAPDIF